MGKNDHIPEVPSLVASGISLKYKICLLTFNSLQGHEPEDISEMLVPRIIHYGLRSQDDLTLVVPKTKRKPLGDRAVRVAAHCPKTCAAATTLAFLRVN